MENNLTETAEAVPAILEKRKYVRTNQAQTLVPGMFSDRVPREWVEKIKKGKTNIIHYRPETWKNGRMEIIMQRPANSSELRALQAVVIMAATRIKENRPATIEFSENNKNTSKQQLKHKAEGEVSFLQDCTSVRFPVSSRELLAAVGLSDAGKNIKELDDSLKYLSSIAVFVYDDDSYYSTWLLAVDYQENRKQGQYIIALNPQMSLSVLGIASKQNRHSLIDIEEIKNIKHGPTRLIHARLCGWISPGTESVGVLFGTLMKYAFAVSDSELTEMPKKQRYILRQATLQAINNLKKLGWRFFEKNPGQYEITRPKLVKKSA